MKVLSKKSIVIHPPMRKLSLSAGFHALSHAAAFAEELIERYGKLIEGYADQETLIFLQNLNREFAREQDSCQQMMLILHLMVTRQLLLSNRLPQVAASAQLVGSLTERMEQTILSFRHTDRVRWEQIREYRSLIGNESLADLWIHEEEVIRDSYREKVVSADLTALERIRLQYHRESRDVLTESAEQQMIRPLPPVVFHMQRVASRMDASLSPLQELSEQKLLSDRSIALASSAKQDTNYQMGDSLVFRSDQKQEASSEPQYNPVNDSKNTDEQVKIHQVSDNHTNGGRIDQSRISDDMVSVNRISGSEGNLPVTLSSDTMDLSQATVRVSSDITGFHPPSAGRMSDGFLYSVGTEDHSQKPSDHLPDQLSGQMRMQSDSSGEKVSVSGIMPDNVLDVGINSQNDPTAETLILKIESQVELPSVTERPDRVTEISSSDNRTDRASDATTQSKDTIPSSEVITKVIDGVQTESGQESVQEPVISEQILHVETGSEHYPSGETLILKTEKQDGNPSTSVRSENDAAKAADKDSRLADTLTPAMQVISQESGMGTSAGIRQNLQMNSFLSQGAFYFAGVEQKYRSVKESPSRLLIHTIEHTVSSAGKGVLFRALSLLNHPERNDDRQRQIIREAVGTVFQENSHDSVPMIDLHPQENYSERKTEQQTGMSEDYTRSVGQQAGQFKRDHQMFEPQGGQWKRDSLTNGEPTGQLKRNTLSIEKRTELLTLTIRQLASHGLTDPETGQRLTLTPMEDRLLVLLKRNGGLPGEVVRTVSQSGNDTLTGELIRYYRQDAREMSYETVRRLLDDKVSARTKSALSTDFPMETVKKINMITVTDTGRIDRKSEETGKKEWILSEQTYSYSGYPLIKVIPLIKRIGTSEISREISLRTDRFSSLLTVQDETAVPAYRDTAVKLSVAERPRSVSERSEETRHSVPKTPEISKEALIQKYGNLIDGADPFHTTGDRTVMNTSVSMKGQGGHMVELTTKISRMEEEARQQSKALENLTKRQKQMEEATLKTTDLQKLSQEVINQLRTKLRFDRSRYS